MVVWIGCDGVAGPDQTLQGNVDPMVLFGSEEIIRQHVAEVVAAAGPKHILGVGHGVVQGTPEGNVGIFIDAAKESMYSSSKVMA